MPVRKIPKNHVSVTGHHSTAKSIENSSFESPLENDYYILLDFDIQVERYEVQPVRIPVPGVPQGYVPDVLVHFHRGSDGLARPSELTEIKSQADLNENCAAYEPKFAVARCFAQERGWVFVCRSDRDIRTPRLSNLKFLRAYRRLEPAADDLAHLIAALAAQGGRSSVIPLLGALAVNDESKARLLPSLWHLLATHRIRTDLDVPFSEDVPVWLPD